MPENVIGSGTFAICNGSILLKFAMDLPFGLTFIYYSKPQLLYLAIPHFEAPCILINEIYQITNKYNKSVHMNMRDNSLFVVS